MTLVSGNRVRVTAFTTATTTATGRRLVVAVARCSGSASSPVCKSAASSRITLAPGPDDRAADVHGDASRRPAGLAAGHGPRDAHVVGARPALLRRHAPGRRLQGRQPLQARRRPAAVRRDLASPPRHAPGHRSSPRRRASRSSRSSSTAARTRGPRPPQAATTAVTTIGYPNQPPAPHVHRHAQGRDPQGLRPHPIDRHRIRDPRRNANAPLRRKHRRPMFSMEVPVPPGPTRLTTATPRPRARDRGCLRPRQGGAVAKPPPPAVGWAQAPRDPRTLVAEVAAAREDHRRPALVRPRR